MLNKSTMKEYAEHSFSGSFPDIPYFDTVDAALLTQGDDAPFFITLALAEIGRVSDNGLLYDEALVRSIGEQLKGGGGIRGHIAEGEESTAFPVDAVDWVGAQMVDNKLWAKGYVPPGETREYIRRVKARGGKLGTSIFGYSARETVNEEQGVWRAVEFDLHTVDLAPAKRASLKMGGDFQITPEMQNNLNSQDMEGDMPISITDVPDAVREQIIEQAQLQSRLERVAEIEAERDTLAERIQEMDETLAQRDQTISEMREALDGAMAQISEFQNEQFNTRAMERVTDLTNWNVEGDTHQQRLQALRNRLLADVMAEMGDERTDEALEAAVNAVSENNRVIIETVRDALAGPSAFVPDNAASKSASGNSGINDTVHPMFKEFATEEGRDRLLKRWGFNS